MNLNHLNPTVTDALETQRFLMKYFGMRTFSGSEEADGTPAMAFLTDDSGMILSLMRASRTEVPEYPGFFHIGFGQPNEEAVNEINRRLKEDGFEVDPPARMHGSWTFYFMAPGGIRIEVLS